MSKPRWTAEEAREARDRLKGYIESDRPDAIYGVVTGVAPSGMSRMIEFYCPCIEEGHPSIMRVTYLVAKILDLVLTNQGARVHGGGMDMVYDTVDSLSHALYGKPGMIKSRNF
jgi:hypothetical protein